MHMLSWKHAIKWRKSRIIVPGKFILRLSARLREIAKNGRVSEQNERSEQENVASQGELGTVCFFPVPLSGPPFFLVLPVLD